MRTDPTRWMPVVLGLLVLGVLILAYQNHRLAGRVAVLEKSGGEGAANAERGPRGSGDRAAHERLETVDGSVLVAGEGRRRGRGRSHAGVDGGPAGDEDPTLSMDELLEDPEFQSRLGDLFTEYSSNERAERRERRTDYVADRISETVAEFAADHDLDAETEAQVSQILTNYMAQRMELRDAMMDGDGDNEELRAERERLSEDTDSALIELLGQELFDELDVQVPGPGRRR